MTIEDFRERRAHRNRESIPPFPRLVMRDYRRHTVDVDRDLQRWESVLHRDRLWGWCTFWCLVGAAIGYGVTRFVVGG